MSKSCEALVEPAVLKWARESRRFPLAVAAKKIGVSEERLEAFETGARRPTVGQVRKMSSVYKRSMAALFLREPPAEIPPPHDYRRLPQVSPGDMSPELALAIRGAREHQASAQQLARLLIDELPRFGVNARTTDDPEVVAGRFRDALGVELNEQQRCRDAYKALRFWKDRVEAAGVLVFQASGVSTAEMRGFLLPASEFPAIVVNSSDSAFGRVFSLLHELAHLALGGDSLCNSHGDQGDGPVEAFCNRVAAATIMPATDVLSDAAVSVHDGPWSVSELEQISRRFGASVEAVLLRLVSLGRADQSEYSALRPCLSVRRAGQSGRGDYYNNVLSRLGRPLVRLALDASSSGLITLAEASRHLGVQAANFANLEKRALA